MRVLLLADVKKVGRRGEVREVSNGYAHSVLFPKKLAVLATDEVINRVTREEKQKEAMRETKNSLWQKEIKKIFEKPLVVSLRSNESGTLFESVHPSHLARVIKEVSGVSVPESAIEIKEHIKKTGTYTAIIHRAEGREEISFTVE